MAVRRGRDPWWDLDGRGARRTRRRRAVVAGIAFVIAAAADAMVGLVWAVQLGFVHTLPRL